MTYEIIDNIEVPVTAVTRTRARGEFATALDKLDIGQGFVFSDKRELKKLYPSVAPTKFPSDVEGLNKKFKLWQVSEGKFGVKRLDDVKPVEKAEPTDA